MILNAVDKLKHMLKRKTVNIYDTVFKLHTKYTGLLFSGLVGANVFFGEPITCLGDGDLDFVEQICWPNGTSTLTNVTTIVDGYLTIQEVPERQLYYQWIIILFQCTYVYVPAYLWKGWENGLLSGLCSNLGDPIITDQTQHQKRKLVDYLKSDNTRVHSAYVMRYVACEVMNFLILVLNMWLLEAMFKPIWVRYLPVDSMGPSGSQRELDAPCLLAQNIVNETIFAFMHIWFVALLVISVCNIIFRCISLASSNMGLKMMRSVVMSSSPMTRLNIEIILRNRTIGDWFILYRVGRNLNPIVFKEVLYELADSKRNMIFSAKV